MLINTKITRCKTFVILLFLLLFTTMWWVKKKNPTCPFCLSHLNLECWSATTIGHALSNSYWCKPVDVLCLHWLDSYDVLFRLHLSAYFLLHVLNDKVTFYDMHSSVFNIEVLPSSHLFICYTRLLFFQPLISDTILTALSPGVKGWHHPCSRGQWLVSDNIITCPILP